MQFATIEILPRYRVTPTTMCLIPPGFPDPAFPEKHILDICHGSSGAFQLGFKVGASVENSLLPYPARLFNHLIVGKPLRRHHLTTG